MKDMNIDLKCPQCQKEFKLPPNDVLEKDTLSCPECGCNLNEEELRDLKIAVKYMLGLN